MQRIMRILLCGALLTSPVLALETCPSSPDPGVKAASCCGPGCTCEKACGGRTASGGSSLGRCATDHATSHHSDLTGNLTNAVMESRSTQVLAAVVHPAELAAAPSAAQQVVASELDVSVLPALPRQACELFCTLLL